MEEMEGKEENMTHLLEKMMSTEDFRQPKVKEVKVGGHWLEQMEVQAHCLPDMKTYILIKNLHLSNLNWKYKMIESSS